MSHADDVAYLEASGLAFKKAPAQMSPAYAHRVATGLRKGQTRQEARRGNTPERPGAVRTIRSTHLHRREVVSGVKTLENTAGYATIDTVRDSLKRIDSEHIDVRVYGAHRYPGSGKYTEGYITYSLAKEDLESVLDEEDFLDDVFERFGGISERHVETEWGAVTYVAIAEA